MTLKKRKNFYKQVLKIFYYFCFFFSNLSVTRPIDQTQICQNKFSTTENVLSQRGYAIFDKLQQRIPDTNYNLATVFQIMAGSRVVSETDNSFLHFNVNTR